MYTKVEMSTPFIQLQQPSTHGQSCFNYIHSFSASLLPTTITNTTGLF